MPKEESKAYQIGDKVRFVKTTQRGNSFHMRTLEGKIEGFSMPNKRNARVKYHGGNHIWLPVGNLRRLDQPSQLDDMFGLGKKPKEEDK